MVLLVIISSSAENNHYCASTSLSVSLFLHPLSLSVCLFLLLALISNLVIMYFIKLKNNKGSTRKIILSFLKVTQPHE